MAVLYRKYRPQTFAQVLSQKPVVNTLQNQVKSGQPAHAYLFTGSRGVGKTSIARILAKAVNCQNNQQGDACGSCEVCRQIEAGNFMDLVEIDAASNTGVDNIREIIEHVRFSPSLGKYKIFIIDEVHMLSKGAFNALLKTLEEPPAHAIFILATTEIAKVPATIISRTQRFDFKALSQDDILAHLVQICQTEQMQIGNDVLELIAQNAEGSVRDSLSLLGKVATLGDNPSLEECQQLLGVTDIAVCEELLNLIVYKNAEQIPDFFARQSERGADYAVLNRDFLEYLRKILIHKATGGKVDFVLQEQRLETLASLAAAVEMSELILIIRLFLKAYKDLSGAAEPQLPLLLASLEAVYRKTGPGAVQSVKPASNPPLKKNEILASPESDELPDAHAQVQTATKTEVSLAEARELFPEIIEQVRKQNGPLASVLRSSQLAATEPGRLVVAVKFAFNKQNLENPKNAALINAVIEKVSGKRLALSARMAVVDKVASPGVLDPLAQALKVFGGELVE